MTVETRAQHSNAPHTWVAVADLHGHPTQFASLLHQLDAFYGEEYTLVTLGDYVDNGPDIPGLLDALIQLRSERPTRFIPILGNHDLACLRALGWPHDAPDPAWFRRWSSSYWNPGGSTAAAYGAGNATALAEKMPAHHKAFLRSLPWYYDTGRYLFVHAGMLSGPLGPQRAALAHKLLPENPLYLPHPIRLKALATVDDPDWERVVVSGHTKRPGHNTPHSPNLLGENRICLSAELDAGGALYAVALPSRKIWSVDA